MKRAAYLVIYEGQPEDREEFLRFYIEEHIPIIWSWPKIRGVEIELGTASGDPHANEAGVFMIARFLFDSLEDLQAALQSEGRERARADRVNFPPFHGTVHHQAVEILEVPRGSE